MGSGTVVFAVKDHGIKPCKPRYASHGYRDHGFKSVNHGTSPHGLIPVREMVYKIDEEKFSYNKDSDEWFCSQGNKTVKKRYMKRKCLPSTSM